LCQMRLTSSFHNLDRVSGILTRIVSGVNNIFLANINSTNF
jgi:hypothetical protein